MLQVPRLTVGMILSPRVYSDRVYAEAGGAANALEINLGNGQMEAIGNQSREPIDRRRLIISTTSSLADPRPLPVPACGDVGVDEGVALPWRAACVIDPADALSAEGEPRCHRRSGQPPRATETMGSAPGAARRPADDAGDPDRVGPGRRAVSLVPPAVVGLRPGLRLAARRDSPGSPGHRR